MLSESGKSTGKLRFLLMLVVNLAPNHSRFETQNMGKGSLWRVEQLYKQNLIQALNRSSYHPCSATGEKLSPSNKGSPRPADSPPFKVTILFLFNYALFFIIIYFKKYCFLQFILP